MQNDRLRGDNNDNNKTKALIILLLFNFILTFFSIQNIEVYLVKSLNL